MRGKPPEMGGVPRRHDRAGPFGRLERGEAVFRAWAAQQEDEMRTGMLDRPATPAAREAGFPDWLPDALGSDPIRIDPAEGAPFAIDYAQGEAGADRLAAAVACHDRDPGGSFVIIDAGTCITVDLLSPGRWRGGAILPGLGLQSASLADAGLPVLDKGEAGWSCRARGRRGAGPVHPRSHRGGDSLGRPEKP